MAANLSEKQKLAYEFFEELSRISESNNPLDVSRGFIQLEKTLFNIYETAYLAGFKEGEKANIRLLSN